MKIILSLFAAATLFVACDKKVTEEAAPSAEQVTLPVELSYKGATKLGDMKNVKSVLESNKRLSEMNPDIGEFLADSVTMHLADGVLLSGPRDSILADISAFINSLESIKIEFIAAVPVDNMDLKHEWVFCWTEETHHYKDGRVVIQELHEDYRLEGGKIREIFQYTRKPE
jgi:hypothetical protein